MSASNNIDIEEYVGWLGVYWAAATVVLTGAMTIKFLYLRRTSFAKLPPDLPFDKEQRITSDIVHDDRDRLHLYRGWKDEDSRVSLESIASQVEWMKQDGSGYGEEATYFLSFWSTVMVVVVFGALASAVMFLALSGLMWYYQKHTLEITDQYAQTGGDSKNPLIFTASFPKRERGQVYRILLEAMDFILGPRDGSCEVHVINSRFVDRSDAVLIPEEWVEAFSGMEQWDDVLAHIESMEMKQQRIYQGNNLAPHWFVNEWGCSAWNCANQTAVDGRGIIAFCGWRGYFESQEGILEYLFCRCLAAKFPESVYISRGRRLCCARQGFYMSGNELLPEKYR